MKSRAKSILNFLLIFGTLAIVLIIGFSGNDIGQTIDAIRSIPLRWVFCCLGAYVLFLFLEGLALFFFLRRQGARVTLRYCFFIAIIGQYYSNITPGASGGQPMQVWYLHKKGVSIGLGSSALVVKLFCFQFMLLVLGTLFWALYPGLIRENLGGNMWILIVGYVYNAFVVSLLIAIGLNKHIVEWIVNTAIRIGAKLRICKDPAASRVRWMETVDRFHGSITMLRHHPRDLIVQLLIGGAQLLSLMCVIFFLYKGFRLTGATWGELIALGLMIYTSAAYTPLPGASGAQEGVFTLYLGKIFPYECHFSALLLWRFFTYYVSLILGAIVTIGLTIREKQKPPAVQEAESIEEHEMLQEEQKEA